MGFIDLIWAYVIIFILAATPLVEAMYLAPIAILAGLPTIPVLLISIAGNLLTVFLVILFVEAIKRRFFKNRSENKRTARARKLWDRFGPVGLAFLGAPIVGSHLAALLSLSFGGTRNRVAIWMTISIAGWTIVLSVLGHFGFTVMNPENPLIERFLPNVAGSEQ